MTGTRERIRAITLTVLMVVSMFGGVVAFAGSATADLTSNANEANFDTAGNVQDPSDNAQAGTTSALSAAKLFGSSANVQQITISGAGASGFDGSFSEIDGSEVEVRIYRNADNYRDNTIGAGNTGADTTFTTQADVASTSNNGETITVDTGSSFNVGNGDVVEVAFTDDFLNPTSGGTFNGLTFDPNVGSSQEATGPLVVQSSGGGGGGGGPTQPVGAWEDQTTKFQGQILEFTPNSNVANLDSSDDYRLYECNYDSVAEECDTTLVEDLDDTQPTEIDTDGLQGDYVIAVDNGETIVLTDSNGVADGTVSGSYENPSTSIVVQNLDTEFADSSVPSGSQIDVNFRSRARSSYTVVVSSDDFNQDELGSITGGSDRGDSNVTISISSTDEDVSFDFAGISQGSYDFQFDVLDTTASDSASVEVVAQGDTSATLTQNVYNEQRGDVVEITADLSNTDRATFTIGSDDVNYVSEVTVEDTDDDDQVTFTMDTLEAGTGGTDEANRVYDAGDDTVTNAERTTDPGVTPIQAAEYDVTAEVRVGSRLEQTDAGLISLEERSTNGAQVFKAPSPLDRADAGKYNGELSNVLNASSPGSTVADGDHVVMAFEVSGIYAYVDGKEDFNDSNAANFSDDGVSTPGGADGSNTAIGLTLEDADSSVNAQPDSFSINNNNGVLVLPDAENDTLYVAVEPDAYDGVEAGNEYRVTVTLPEENAYIDDADSAESINRTFTLVERQASFDTDEEGIVTVEAESGQTISGTTNAAPGTELDIRASSSTFVKTDTVEVADNGSFSGTFDFSNVTENTSFTATLPRAGYDDDASTPGRVGAAETGAATFNNQSFTGSATSVNVASVTVSEGGFVTIHDSTLLDGAVFDSVRGTSSYLEPGTAENVTVDLDRPIGANESGDTFFAMPHLDTDGDETYDFLTSEGADDGPYTDSEGNAVVDPATITVDRVATVTFNDQSSSGETVLVESTRLPAGGFVTIHDNTVADDPFGSVRGTSEYLEPGTSADINVSLDDPIEESGQFFAMPHRDTDGDETYDFVSSDGADDAPYLNGNGEIVLDGAQVSVAGPATASVTFEDQELSEDGTVTVASVTMSQGGFVTIHDDTVGDDPIGSVVGTSDFLESGTTEDVEIAVDSTPGQHFAMPHLDTNGNEEYDFVSSEAQADAPYVTADGSIVLDGAEISAPMMDESPTETPTEMTAGEDGDDTETPGTETGGQPGFGAVIAVLALLGAALLARRN